MRGTFTPIGFTVDDLGVIGDRLIVCAGLTDGIRLHEATGESVACGVRENNVASIADSLAERHKGELIVAVDNNGAGQRAAEKSGWLWACPRLDKDWSDVYQNEGPQAVKDQVNEIVPAAAATDATAPPEWVEPADPFAENVVLPFPLHTLPHSIQRFCSEKSAQSGFDPGGYAFCLLIAAGCTVDHRVRMDVGPMKVPAFTWGALVVDAVSAAAS